MRLPDISAMLPPMPQTLQWGLLAGLLLLNGSSFLLYRRDKLRAQRSGRRIPEKTLLRSAWLLGGLGAALAMKLYRHKTLQPRFGQVTAASLSTTAALILLLVWPLR